MQVPPLGAIERGIEENMAETATTATTTRPSRARKAAAPANKPAAAKPAATPVAPAAEPQRQEVTRFKVELEHVGTTKTYEKFTFPDSYKGTVVGNVYAPIGTARVGVVIIGRDDQGDSDN